MIGRARPRRRRADPRAAADQPLRPCAAPARRRADAAGGELRDYGVGAQILLDLGVREMVLLSNTAAQTIVGLDGYGLQIVGAADPADRPTSMS